MHDVELHCMTLHNKESEKWESGMTLQKREFTPESGNVDTGYAVLCFRKNY